METTRVQSLAQEILGLPEPERQELARRVLPSCSAHAPDSRKYTNRCAPYRTTSSGP